MKKLYFILFSMLLLGTTACNEPLIPDQADVEGPLVDIYFNLQLPEATPTKAMGNTPQIQSVWVVEFGAAGYFKRWAKAIPVNGHITADGTAYGKTYRVEVPLSSAEQRFHIIAGYFSSTAVPDTYTGQTELEVINSLETTGTSCAFWQRIVVPTGIHGTKQSDGTYIATAESQAFFNTVPLVRNFAKVAVTTNNSAYTILQYALVNTPTKGKVAPYDPENHGFVSGYGVNSVAALTFSSLYNQGNGYVPQNVAISAPTSASSLTYRKPSDSDPYLYMYERPLPKQDPTCVLVQISRGSSTEWFKVEVLDNGKYVPIYRDFMYTINIDEISGNGESSAQAALEGVAFGDVSASLETASLTSISDGKSTLTVDFTDKTAALGETFVTLGFELATPADAINPNITIEVYDAGSGAVTTLGTPTITTRTVGTSKIVEGSVRVNLSSSSSSIKKSTLRVTGLSDNYRALYRDVNIRVMGKRNFGLTGTGGNTQGNNVTITVQIEDELGRSIFPLNILIQADDNSFSSSTLPVQVGESPFVSGKNTFWFVRTISYAEYAATPANSSQMKSFPCVFVRNKTVSTSTVVRVKEQRDTYFNTKTYTCNF